MPPPQQNQVTLQNSLKTVADKLLNVGNYCVAEALWSRSTLMDEGIAEVTNYAEETEMEFHLLHPPE